MFAWAIRQIVSVTKTDTFTTATTTFGTAITGIDPAITLQTAASKVRVSGSIMVSNTLENTRIYLRVMRGSTAVGIGDAAGDRDRVTAFIRINNVSGTELSAFPLAFSFIDEPGSVGPHTYTVQIRTDAGTACVNRNGSDADNVANPRGISTLELMEVVA
jgi:hypothetical protein